LALSALLGSKSHVLAEPGTPSQEKIMNGKSIKDTARWREKMQELYKTLAEITTDTSSDRRFNAPENKERIEKNTKNLADRAHELSKKGLSPDADPTIRILSDLFQDETKRAYWALEETDTRYLMSFDLPGVPKESVNIELHDHQLVVSGEKTVEHKEDSKTHHIIERSHGSFKRVFTIVLAGNSIFQNF